MSRSNKYGATGVMVVAAAVATILTGCASMPKAPPGSEAVRSKLMALKSEPSLATRVPVALEEAEKAVVLAETPQRDAEIAAHRVYLADRLVDAARATAETRFAEEQRAGLKQQSDDARLAARTREADMAQRTAAAARNEAENSRLLADNARLAAATARTEATAARGATETARNEADAARSATETARNEANAARSATEAARNEADAARSAIETARNEANAARSAATDAANAAATAAATAAANAAATAAAQLAESQKQELARQIALLQARTTERGIVLTLGDVLFATGSEQLKTGAAGNLDRLAAFMGMYGDRTATIEGHTDSVGDEAYNQGLSQRRADSVKSYLAGKGVAAARLTSIGKGESQPIAGNESADGRQQNRRVEVVIGNDTKSAAVMR